MLPRHPNPNSTSPSNITSQMSGQRIPSYREQHQIQAFLPSSLQGYRNDPQIQPNADAWGRQNAVHILRPDQSLESTAPNLSPSPPSYPSSYNPLSRPVYANASYNPVLASNATGSIYQRQLTPPEMKVPPPGVPLQRYNSGNTTSAIDNRAPMSSAYPYQPGLPASNSSHSNGATYPFPSKGTYLAGPMGSRTHEPSFMSALFKLITWVLAVIRVLYRRYFLPFMLFFLSVMCILLAFHNFIPAVQYSKSLRIGGTSLPDFGWNERLKRITHNFLGAKEYDSLADDDSLDNAAGSPLSQAANPMEHLITNDHDQDQSFLSLSKTHGGITDEVLELDRLSSPKEQISAKLFSEKKRKRDFVRNDGTTDSQVAKSLGTPLWASEPDERDGPDEKSVSEGKGVVDESRDQLVKIADETKVVSPEASDPNHIIVPRQDSFPNAQQGTPSNQYDTMRIQDDSSKGDMANDQSDGLLDALEEENERENQARESTASSSVLHRKSDPIGREAERVDQLQGGGAVESIVADTRTSQSDDNVGDDSSSAEEGWKGSEDLEIVQIRGSTYCRVFGACVSSGNPATLILPAWMRIHQTDLRACGAFETYRIVFRATKDSKDLIVDNFEVDAVLYGPIRDALDNLRAAYSATAAQSSTITYSCFNSKKACEKREGSAAQIDGSIIVDSEFEVEPASAILKDRSLAHVNIRVWSGGDTSELCLKSAIFAKSGGSSMSNTKKSKYHIMVNEVIQTAREAIKAENVFSKLEDREVEEEFQESTGSLETDDSRAYIEAFQFATHPKMPACRVFTACREADGTLVVSERLKSHAELLDSCGFAKVKFEKDYMLVGSSSLASSISDMFMESNDLLGIDILREHQAHFVMDFLPRIPVFDVSTRKNISSSGLDVKRRCFSSAAGPTACHKHTIFNATVIVPDVLQASEADYVSASISMQWVVSFLNMFPTPTAPVYKLYDKKLYLASQRMCFRSIANARNFVEFGDLLGHRNLFFRANQIDRQSVFAGKRKEKCDLVVYIFDRFARGSSPAIVNANELKRAIKFKAHSNFFSSRYSLAVEVHTVFFDELSVAEQIAIMQKADVVIGSHGVLLSNVLFMRQQAVLFEIQPFGYYAGPYDLLARAANLRYTRLSAFPDTATFSNCLRSKSKITPTRVQALLKRWDAAVLNFTESSAMQEDATASAIENVRTILRMERESTLEERACARSQFLAVDENFLAKLALEEAVKSCKRI